MVNTADYIKGYLFSCSFVGYYDIKHIYSNDKIYWLRLPVFLYRQYKYRSPTPDTITIHLFIVNSYFFFIKVIVLEYCKKVDIKIKKYSKCNHVN